MEISAPTRERLAETLVPCLFDSSQWVHRRVESLVVPLPERPMFVRRLSIDFSIPDIEPIRLNPDGTSRFLIPLSLVSKWPPLLSFDLHDEQGYPIPFLTARQTAALDAAILKALAVDVCGEPLEPTLNQALEGVAKYRDPQSWFSLFRAIPLAETHRPRELDRHRLLLRNDLRFVAIGSQLTANSFLWCSVDGIVGDRRIIKCALQKAWSPRGRDAFLPSLSLRPFVVSFALPHFGDRESYHLTVTAPEPMRVVDAELALTVVETPTSARETSLVRWTAHGRQQAPREMDVYAAHTETQARFYVSGPRLGAEGTVFIAVEVDTNGFLNGAAGAAVAVALLLWLFAVSMEDAVAVADAGVAVLLLGPLLLSYVLVRPREHVLVGGYLVNVRRLLIGAGVLPVAGAAALALSHNETGTSVWMWISAVLATVFAMLFIALRLLPRGRSTRPLSNTKTAAALIDPE